MRIAISFLKIARFLLFPVAFLFLANSSHAQPGKAVTSLNFPDIMPNHLEFLFSVHYSSEIFQDDLLSKRKKRKHLDEGKETRKEEHCTNEIINSESEEGMIPVKSYQQLKGILEEVDMMVSGWI